MTSLDKDLWCQIVWSTAEGEGLLVSFDDLGQTEVGEANVAVFVHQDILWLKISVDDILLVQVAQSHGYLDSVESCTVLREASHLSKVHEELATSDKAHDEEDLCFGLEYVAHADKERMISLQQNVFL